MPSIRDVAQAAGVAIATVSAALNGTAPVSAETRQKVLDAARRLGYTPNAVARSLRQGQTRLVALVVSDITNPFFGALARAVETAAGAEHYAVMFGDTDEDPERERAVLRLLRGQRVAGVILAPCGQGEDYRAELQATAAAVPMVTVDREVDGVALDFCGLDSHAAGRVVTEYLIRLGHRRIGFVGGKAGLANAEARRAGWLAAIRAQGLQVDADLAVSGGFRAEQAYRAVQPLLTGTDPATAVVAASNVMALGCMQAVRDLHLSCPADVSIAGIDDMPWATALSPPLTAVAQPIEAIAQAAFAQLQLRIAAAGDPPQRRLFPPALVVRDSCAPAGPR